MSRHAPPPSPVRRAIAAGVVVFTATIVAGHQLAFDDTTSVADAIREMPRSTAEGRAQRTLVPTPTPTPETTDDAAQPTADPVPPAPVTRGGDEPAARPSAAPRSSAPDARSDGPRVAVDPSRTPVSEAREPSPEPSVPPAVPAPVPDVAGGSAAPEPDPIVGLGIPELTNRERLANGCGPVALDPALVAYAEAHSVTQATEGAMRHGDGPEGFSSWGENVAAGQGSAAEVMEDWMGSEGHRENILNCDFTRLGIGSVDGYWTMVLAT